MIPTAASSYTFKQLFRNSVEQYGDCPALSYAGGTPLTYRDVAAKVNELHAIFDGLGIRKGDKVAILGQNMPNWGVAFFACVVRGVVAVPLLPDFHAEEIANILTHSEAKAIFASEKLLPRLPAPELTGCSIRILLDSLTLLTPMPQESPVTVVEEDPKEEDLAVLIYTSGTTGRKVERGYALAKKHCVAHAPGYHHSAHFQGNGLFVYPAALAYVRELAGIGSAHYVRCHSLLSGSSAYSGRFTPCTENGPSAHHALGSSYYG